MKKQKTRICIYLKDIMILTGKSHKTARRISSQIRKTFGKPDNAFITIREFAIYMGMDEAYIQEQMH